MPPAPVAISTPAVMPVAPPPPPVAAVPVIPIPEAVRPVAPVSAAPPAPVISAPPPPVAHAEPAVPAAPDIHSQANPVPPLRDYSKQIEAIFSASPVPAPPAAPEKHHAPVPPAPSTEHLKEEAARLQAQLSSLLFTQTPSAPPVVPAPPPVHLDAPKTVSEVAPEPPKSAAAIESKPAVPAQKLSSLPLGADEEVRMPSWLAPLSQNSEPAAVESPASPEVAHDHSVSLNSEESYDALVGGSHPRPQTAVFGGQLLGESSASAADSSRLEKRSLLRTCRGWFASRRWRWLVFPPEPLGLSGDRGCAVRQRCFFQPQRRPLRTPPPHRTLPLRQSHPTGRIQLLQTPKGPREIPLQSSRLLWPRLPLLLFLRIPSQLRKIPIRSRLLLKSPCSAMSIWPLR